MSRRARLKRQLRYVRKNETAEECAARLVRDAAKRKEVRLLRCANETEAQRASRRAHDAARKRIQRQRAKLEREQFKKEQISQAIVKPTRSLKHAYKPEHEIALSGAREAERKSAYRKSHKLATQRDDQCNGDLSSKVVWQKEITEYHKMFPNLENITNRRVHCTSCNFHIGTAPINESIIKMHPILRVIQCINCYSFYNSGDFDIGEDGSEFYCRWCGQGGEVYCCSKCPKVYCRRCIEQNFSIRKMNEIQNCVSWVCFVCDPACMIQLRAEYWALLRFIEKQKDAIMIQSLSENDLQKAMNADSSKCCKNVNKDTTSDTSGGVVLENENRFENCFNFESILSEADKSGSTNEINTSILNQYQSVLPKLSQSWKLVLPDLESCIHQDIYHLTNDQLIQIRNPQSVLPPTSNTPTNLFMRSIAAVPSRTTHTSSPSPVHLSVEQSQNIPLTESLNVSNANQVQLVQNKINIETVPEKRKTKKKTISKYSLHKAKAQFEVRVEHSTEVCKHIVTKMEMLTKSSSYKNVKTLLDVRELIMHLSYLLTYADSRFKTLQEKCVDDIKVMGFDSNFSKYNDLQQLESNTSSLIENSTDVIIVDECTTTVQMMKRNLLRAASSPLEIPEEKFQRLFRLSKESFKYVLEMVHSKFKSNKKNKHTPPILKLAVALQFFAEGCLPQPVECYAEGISNSTLSSIIPEVVTILDLFYSSFIQFDQGKEEIENCKHYYSSETGFPGIIGCIDSFHVRIVKPTFYEYLYYNRNGNYSLNVMATCNHQLLITSVAANHGGGSFISSAWLNSLERQFLEKEYLAGDTSSWLLGDSNFPLEPWLIVPFENVRNDTDKTFNELHSKCRATIKMCFGMLTGRFRCLSNTKELSYRPERAAQIINVACMLHNICLYFNVAFDESLLAKHEEDSNYYWATHLDTPNALLTEAEEIRDKISRML